MKTKLYTLPDWKKTLQETGWEDAPKDKDIENAVIQELSRGKVFFAEDTSGSPVKNGDRVTLKIKSALPKYNKEKVVINVGSGLFDKKLEELLCGMKTGGCGELIVKGEKVAFTILKTEKKQYPVLTDELVREQKLEGIKTLAEYRSYLEKKIKSEYAVKLINRLLERLESEARMDEPDEDDIIKVIDLEYEPLRKRFSLDDMSGKEWKENFGKQELKVFYEQIYPDIAKLFGTTGKESYYESRNETAKQTIRSCLILNEILKADEDPTINPDAEQVLMKDMADCILKIIYGG